MPPPSTSTVPAAIDAFLALAASVLPEGFQIIDGPPIGMVLQRDHLLVGGDLEDDTAAGSQVPVSLGARSREERYEITCQLGVYGAASGAQKSVRDRAYGFLASLEDALFADHTLGEVVRFAQVAGPLALDQTPHLKTNSAGEDVVEGRKAVIRFAVACEVRLTRSTP